MKLFPGALLAVCLLAGLASEDVTGGGLTPLPDFSFGGRTRHAGRAYVLDLGGSGPRIVAVGSSGQQSSLKLDAGRRDLLPNGLARSAEGVFWILAEKGRTLVGFDATLGTRAAVKQLPERCQGVWDLAARIVVAPFRVEASEPILLKDMGAAFAPVPDLSTRRGKDPIHQSLLNMFTCGSGAAEDLPCWWIAEEPQIFVFNRAGGVSKLEGRSLARPPAAKGAQPNPAASLVYPVRDVFLLPGGSYWILLNQEGETPPLEEGAVRGRHLIRVSPPAADVMLPLSGLGKVILDADASSALILADDGKFERVRVP